MVYSFFTENTAFYALLVLVAAWSVRSTPTLFDPLSTVTAVLALAVFWLQRRIVVRGILGVSIIIVVTTLGVYAILEPSFIFRYPGVLIGELAYNLLFGFVLFEISDRLLGRGIRQ